MGEIVTPLTITKSADLAFGTLVPNATAERTVSIAASDGATRESTTTDILVGGNGNGNPAAFDVTSSTNNSYAYSIGLSSANNNKLNSDTGSNSMDITYDFSGDENSNQGDQVIYVGGTLTLSGAQPEGSYSDKVTITVSYN